MVKISPRRKQLKLRDDPRFRQLTPQAKTALLHINTAGSISQREAIMDHSIQSLTRRVTEIRDAGFDVVGEWKVHPTTKQRYMRYRLSLSV
jgi:Helix-turn-helix domain